MKVIKVSNTSLPFDDNIMDFVFTANSFHDLPLGYENEIRRVLKNNGYYTDLDWKKNKPI
ncbi:MAG: methyltransferase domain-containing protein [Candidatus Micrarchaeia archaeon]